jgi:hypothetical protein
MGVNDEWEIDYEALRKEIEEEMKWEYEQMTKEEWE